MMINIQQGGHADFSMRTISQASLCALLLSACLQATAQTAASGVTFSKRVEEEASRPMRWIVESSKLDRTRNRPPSTDTPVAPPAKPKPKATVNASVQNKEAVAEPAAPVRPKAAPVVLAAEPASATSASPEPVRPTIDVAVAPSAQPPSSPSAQTLANNALIPISQEPPDIWRGMCPDGCDQYKYVVSFTVRPDGQVTNVQLVSTNYPRLKNAVLQAVSKWRYRPVDSAQEQEVTLRLAP